MKKFKRILSLLCAALMLLSLTACSGSEDGADGDVTTVTFMYASNMQGMDRLKNLITEFNETAGAELGIVVKGIPKTSALTNLLTSLLPTKGTPDIVLLDDGSFKLFTYYCADITDMIDQEVVDDVYPAAINRYRYNQETMTSNDTDPLYGVPFTGYPTLLHYNQDALEENGIICISVAAEDLDAFNAGTLTDGNGKTKADYGLEVDVPAKGFYRSECPYVPAEGEIDGTSWMAPSDTEVLVFNNQIAMNWDELDDIAMICSQKWNADSSTKYGYYSEWWFNYGWSVGGDCIEDLSGSGDYVYSLPCDLPNYIVQDGKTYTGIYTGTVYNAGETLDVKDIIDAQPGQTITLETENDTTYYFKADGVRADGRDFSAELANGTLYELPSIQSALKRYYSLAGEGGKDVSPYPTALGTTTASQYFVSGKLALLIETTMNATYLAESMTYEYGYAPMPTYKVYTDPTDPNCDTVEIQGKEAFHSWGNVLMVSARSTKQEAACEFLNWFASEGQTWMANTGETSVRISDREKMLENLTAKNPTAVVHAMEYGQPGDWWYLPERTWIDQWSTPMNNEVRNGKMSFDEFIYGYTTQTNKVIEELLPDE